MGFRVFILCYGLRIAVPCLFLCEPYKKAKPSTLLFELVISYYSRGIVVGMIMEFRSKSCRDERLQIESNGGGKVAPTSMQDLRCQSAKNASSGRAHQIGSTGKEVKVKRGKRTAAKPSKSWSFSDPELQRKKRVASYKIYVAEGKMKGSLRKSFRWIKNTYTQALYGWW
ncbi:unnamed protein product [Sphenostylis stenocarpa]|uniref:Uncharacterized protein n=1 Tax=Sphenostylis stenocarpa TaxID=92480 RepID=A0AA86VCH7_9FABA|nr:unnamed protein product [Sphenostylis stenocarpa]